MAITDNQPTNKNFLSPLGFRFILSRTPNIEYFCQAATLPNMVMAEALTANPFTSALGNFSVGGDLTVTGSATVGGVGIVTVGSAGFVTSITAGSNISVSGATGNVTITGLANTSNVVADNLVVTGISTLEATTATALNVTGVVTATAFVGSGAQLTGIAQPTQLDITSSLFT